MENKQFLNNLIVSGKISIYGVYRHMYYNVCNCDVSVENLFKIGFDCDNITMLRLLRISSNLSIKLNNRFLGRALGAISDNIKSLVEYLRYSKEEIIGRIDYTINSTRRIDSWYEFIEIMNKHRVIMLNDIRDLQICINNKILYLSSYMNETFNMLDEYGNIVERSIRYIGLNSSKSIININKITNDSLNKILHNTKYGIIIINVN